MSAETSALITVFVILQIKHFIFDYPLQTAYQLRNKGTYGHPGGILHSGLHLLGTSVSFLAVTPSLPLAAVILGSEFVLHYHIDWSKDQITRWIRATAHDRAFWWAIGFDQLLHHLTYVGIAIVLVRYGSY